MQKSVESRKKKVEILETKKEAKEIGQARAHGFRKVAVTQLAI